MADPIQRQPGSPAERAAAGKAARVAGAALEPRRVGRRRPTGPTRSSCSRARPTSRVGQLVPMRYGRMLASPFAFYRGAAAVMAADLAGTPRSAASRCSSAATPTSPTSAPSPRPSGELVFDVNDFDETLPGPWEWDVKRLAASFAVAGRDRGFDAARAAARSSPRWRREYREAMRRLRRAGQPRGLVHAARRGDDRRALGRRGRASKAAQGVRAQRRQGARQGQHARPLQAHPARSTAGCASSATRR